jgi:hypothetical protein
MKLSLIATNESATQILCGIFAAMGFIGGLLLDVSVQVLVKYKICWWHKERRGRKLLC